MTDQTTASPVTVTGAAPAHDPATYRVVPASSSPLDADRVASLLAAEWERFEAHFGGLLGSWVGDERRIRGGEATSA